MLIQSFRIENFKCFRNSGEIALSSGFNIFVGQNNSGKTSIVKALKQIEFDKPHKTSIVFEGEVLDPTSRLSVSLCVPVNQMREYLIRSNQRIRILRGLNINNDNDFVPEQYVKEFFEKGEVTTNLIIDNLTGLRLKEPINHSVWGKLSLPHSVECMPSNDRKSLVLSGQDSNGGESISSHAWGIYSGSTFHFDAQRFVSAPSIYAESIALKSDGSNLARCILDLNEFPSVYDKFVEHVNSVIPSIKWINASNPEQQGITEIRVSTVSRSESRPELQIPLSECGTGVGQVMAVLYAALKFREPKIILIDEPNSFLHPSAAKRLIEILKLYDHHQYILTTHSSEIIAAAEPAHLHLTRWTGKESIVELGTWKSLRHKELVLADLGITMSDVFGANAIVWVEGMTEQLCFPKLLKADLSSNSSNVKFIGVKDVGSFDKDKTSAELLWDAYEKLSSADTISPPTINFCFDKEGRTKKEREDISSRSKGKVRFLPRRNYESYLIHPGAIAAVLSRVDFDEEINLDKSLIIESLEFLATAKGAIGRKEWEGNILSQKWLGEVDGAKLLSSIFKVLTNSKQTFDKVSHSTALTDWLLENDQEHLRELINFVVVSTQISTPETV